MPRMTKEEIEAYLVEQKFPEARTFASIEALGERTIEVRMPFRAVFLRQGGTISGPALMTLADTSVYFLVLAMAGPVAGAVTSSLEIKFLARPDPVDVVASATMLRLGKRLAVAAVELRCLGSADLVAHATVTYAIPNS